MSILSWVHIILPLFSIFSSVFFFVFLVFEFFCVYHLFFACKIEPTFIPSIVANYLFIHIIFRLIPLHHHPSNLLRKLWPHPTRLVDCPTLLIYYVSHLLRYFRLRLYFWYPLKMISWPLIKKEKQTIRRRRRRKQVCYKPLLVFLSFWNREVVRQRANLTFSYWSLRLCVFCIFLVVF